ncbi:unnamed protein product [Trichobilharzia regenti]|nr:unnamed protein product [Trichobilharzia regenti]
MQSNSDLAKSMKSSSEPNPDEERRHTVDEPPSPFLCVNISPIFSGRELSTKKKEIA